MKTIAIAGCGKLGTIVARAAARGLLPDYELIGVYSRTPEKARAAADELAAAGKECRVAGTFDELLALRPDFIVEAASPKALRQWALPALSQGTSLVCLSIGAFADDAFYDEARRTAEAHGSRIYIVSGATGGFDVLQTAALRAVPKLSFSTRKAPTPCAAHPSTTTRCRRKPAPCSAARQPRP